LNQPITIVGWRTDSRKMLGQLIGEASRGWFVLTLGYSVLVGGIINNCISALHWVGLIGQKLQNDVCSCVTTLTFRYKKRKRKRLILASQSQKFLNVFCKYMFPFNIVSMILMLL
jgi:hypothetical protein